MFLNVLNNSYDKLPRIITILTTKVLYRSLEQHTDWIGCLFYAIIHTMSSILLTENRKLLQVLLYTIVCILCKIVIHYSMQQNIYWYNAASEPSFNKDVAKNAGSFWNNLLCILADSRIMTSSKMFYLRCIMPKQLKYENIYISMTESQSLILSRPKKSINDRKCISVGSLSTFKRILMNFFFRFKDCAKLGSLRERKYIFTWI